MIRKKSWATKHRAVADKQNVGGRLGSEYCEIDLCMSR